MSRNATIILLILVVTATALGTGLLMVLSSNARISLENNDLREERNEFKDRFMELQSQVSEMNAYLKESQQEMRKLSEEAARARQEAARQTETRTAASTNAAPSFAPPQPIQVRTYLGGEYLGLSWLQPGNLRNHPETGQLIYEPVVRLNENIRRAFTVTKTNVVDRPVSQNATINYNYQPPYTYWWVPVHRQLPTQPDNGGGAPPTTSPITFPPGGGPWSIPSGSTGSQSQKTSPWKGDGSPWLPDLIKPD